MGWRQGVALALVVVLCGYCIYLDAGASLPADRPEPASGRRRRWPRWPKQASTPGNDELLRPADHPVEVMRFARAPDGIHYGDRTVRSTLRRMSMSSAEQAFRRLTIGDSALLATVARGDASGICRLDGRMEALLRIAALVAVDAPVSSYREAVDAAELTGARLEDLYAVLVAVAGTVGSARIVSAAPRIALAAGYDVEAALE